MLGFFRWVVTLGAWSAAQQNVGGEIPPELEGDELPKFVARLQEKLNRVGPLKKSSMTSSPQVGELRHFVQLLEAKLDQVRQLQDGERRERQMEQHMNCMASRHQAQQEQAHERIEELLVQIQKAQQAFTNVTMCQSQELHGLREELRVKVEETERLRAELCNLLNTTQAQAAEMKALQGELQEIPRLEAELIAARRQISMMELCQSAFQEETHSLILELMAPHEDAEEPAPVAAVAPAAQEVVELQAPPEPMAPAAELPSPAEPEDLTPTAASELSCSAELPGAANPAAPAAAPTSAADHHPSSPAEKAAPAPELCAAFVALDGAASPAAGVPAALEAATPSAADASQQASFAEAFPDAPLQGLLPPTEAAPGPAAFAETPAQGGPHKSALATVEAPRPSWPAGPLAEASADAEESGAGSCLDPPAASASSLELSLLSLEAGSVQQLQQPEPPTDEATVWQLSSASPKGRATPPTGLPSEDPSLCPSEEELHTENLVPLAAFTAGALGPAPATAALEAAQGHNEELPAASEAQRQLPPSSEAEEDLRAEPQEAPTPRQPAPWWKDFGLDLASAEAPPPPKPGPGSQSTSDTLPAAGAAAFTNESAGGSLKSGDADFFASLGIKLVGGAPLKEDTGSSSPSTPLCGEGALTPGDDEEFFASLGLLPGGLGS